mgnify:CR=1 FL=1
MRKLLICLALIVAAGAATLYLSPAALLASVQFTERQLAGLDSRNVQVGEFNIHYYEGGPQGAETILMIHGFGADKGNWLRFSRPLTARYHVVALDLPGFGDSSKPEASYDVGTQVERLNAFAKAIGDKKGMTRYGHSYVPLDEALSRVVIDFSGRPGLQMHVPFTRAVVGGFDVDLFQEFFQGFVNHALVSLHIDNLRGTNTHHQIETVFKAFGRALRMAVELDPRMAGQMPSTKGCL